MQLGAGFVEQQPVFLVALPWERGSLAEQKVSEASTLLMLVFFPKRSLCGVPFLPKPIGPDQKRLVLW